MSWLRSWSSHSRATRELALLLLCALVGVLGLPLAIHLAGEATLGEYAHGGAGALLRDFLQGLAAGAVAFWAVALGPYVFVLLMRLALAVARRQRAQRHEV